MKNVFLYDINMPKSQDHSEDIRSMYDIHRNIFLSTIKRIYILSFSPLFTSTFFFLPSSACSWRDGCTTSSLWGHARKKKKKDLHFFLFLFFSLFFSFSDLFISRLSQLVRYDLNNYETRRFSDISNDTNQ